MCERRDSKKYATGFSDNLEPLEALDLSKIKNFDDFARCMSKTAFGGRTLGEAADVLYEMAADKDCFVVGTFSGAMTVAKMGMLICDMIDKGMLNAIISTGALMTHGFVESVGMRHFKYNPKMDDVELYNKGYDRVYDTLELEKNLDDTEEIVAKVLDKIDKNEVLCSYKITELMGKHLAENAEGRAILKSAYSKKVPVYIPAFTDSELGLDMGIYMRRQRIKGEKPFQFNPFLDLEHYTERIKNAKKVGIFTIGGGVPRNWAQQAGPYLDIIDKRIGHGGGYKRINYAVRICPEPVNWGGLSGCTYSEGVSWGKFVPEEEGGRFAEVLADATIAWPIILKAVIERMEKKK
ncbi:deoxyhypusine synthase family protein [Candidatus Woesearchaeota archaeon]|nr:deoxyhypusine synthase family protein [Candidatus Pacearchaeota archaeon]MBI4452308.1 deoxyhypusine synthase family protein [Candidatus Woesearchaeota archaeon]